MSYLEGAHQHQLATGKRCENFFHQDAELLHEPRGNQWTSSVKVDHLNSEFHHFTFSNKSVEKDEKNFLFKNFHINGLDFLNVTYNEWWVHQQVLLCNQTPVQCISPRRKEKEKTTRNEQEN